MRSHGIQSVLILANGDSPTATLAKSLAREHQVILVTDGAVEKLDALGITANSVCGDFDSVTNAARVRWKHLEWIDTPDQNHGDLEKTLQIALSLGAERVTIIGASGGRPDHMLANYSLLLRYCAQVDVTIANETSTVRALCAPAIIRMDTKVGDIISIIAAQRSICTGAGLKWELPSQLEPGTRAISNVAVDDHVEITMISGSAYVCHLTSTD